MNLLSPVAILGMMLNTPVGRLVSFNSSQVSANIWLLLWLGCNHGSSPFAPTKTFAKTKNLREISPHIAHISYQPQAWRLRQIHQTDRSNSPSLTALPSLGKAMWSAHIKNISTSRNWSLSHSKELAAQCSNNIFKVTNDAVSWNMSALSSVTCLSFCSDSCSQLKRKENSAVTERWYAMVIDYKKIKSPTLKISVILSLCLVLYYATTAISCFRDHLLV